jgi:hypothetical protein
MAIALEAENFDVVQVAPDRLVDAENLLRKKTKELTLWRDLQISEKEWRAGLKRKLQAKEFVKFRSQSSVLPVADSEALKYYNENRLKFGDLPFENFKENIKSFLSRTQVERRLKEWYEVLMSKYQVKNLLAGI